MTELAQRIKEAARRRGFEVVGITSVEPLAGGLEALGAWCESGFAAGMEYMTRRPELHANPKDLVPYAASLITLAVNYYATAPEFQHETRFGRVARYAWGRDYHDVIRPRLTELAADIAALADVPGMRARSFVDAVPLLERAAAVRGGLGFFGKNTNLLNARQGSWLFLAEILVDLELEPDAPFKSVSCGTCTRCLAACPTEAFAGPYKLDSRRCISYLTIENKGAIPRDLREGLGEWIFGCDVCQEVCPFNRFAAETAWRELGPESGTGPRLDLADVLSIGSNAEFNSRFRGTALLRPKRRGLLRNAAVVAANIGCTAAVPALQRLIEHDPEPLIREHALWAMANLDRGLARYLADRAMRSDPDTAVRIEARRVMREDC